MRHSLSEPDLSVEFYRMQNIEIRAKVSMPGPRLGRSGRVVLRGPVPGTSQSAARRQQPSENAVSEEPDRAGRDR